MSQAELSAGEQLQIELEAWGPILDSAEYSADQLITAFRSYPDGRRTE